MKLCAIAAEYNPFHAGHAWHIEEARKKSGCDVLMAVMSGDFVQRGEPAVSDKVTRAVAAVKNGADIVVSLPYLYSTQSASVFAHGAVEIMKAAGATHIAFGSECANLENLLDIADTPINPDHLQENLDAGMAFPKAYSLLTTSMKPNDILAVCYLKEIAGTGIEPVLIPRTSDYADETLRPVSSALAIRKALKEGISVREQTPMQELSESFIPWPELYYPYLRTFRLLCDRNVLWEYLMFSEGIENHLKEQAKACSTYPEFLRACTTYRYTASRIRRTSLQAMMQMRKEEVRKLPPFDTIQVLAFNEKGREWLHDMRKKDVRIVSRFARIPFPWREIEFRSALLYTSVFEEEKRREILKREIGGAVYVQ